MSETVLKVLYYVAPVLAGILALAYAWYRARWVNQQDPGTERMQEIGRAVREGAMAFLAREYRVLAVFVVCVAAALAVLNSGTVRLQAVSFVCGACASALAGFFGMRVATAANYRTTNAARQSLNAALRVAFGGGSVMGMAVVGLGVFGLGLLFVIWGNLLVDDVFDAKKLREVVLPVLSGFSLGASSIALFARVGGGIYTKAADVGADLVGKVEAGIPEDDPRNPATIADNVGDNVGDVAGMGADLFESYVGAIVAALVIGATTVQAVPTPSGSYAFRLVLLPLILAAIGIVASIVGTAFVRTKEGGNPQAALNTGCFIAGALFVLASIPVILLMVPDPFRLGADPKVYTPWGIFGAALVGLMAGILIGLLAEYYTSEWKRPARRIAEASETGPATNIIAGIANGMFSVTYPILVLAAGVVFSYHFAGLYGIAIAGVGMLSTTGIQLAVDAYGPIADNAGGCAEMAGLEPEVRQRTDKLDAVGNTTAAIGKGFAIGSAALTALALFSAYQSVAGVKAINVSDPFNMAGLLVGAMMPFLFCSFALRAVGEAAFEMIEEVRRQFREIPGLREGKARPDYARCVDISTKAAIKRMILPGLIAVVTPVIFGIFDKNMLGGLLAGVTASGVMLAIFQANAGGAWDNAKKYIESGALGGKGSEAHKAAVIGDTVGDPFKDTSGPSLNILIKLMSVVSLVIAPMLQKMPSLLRKWLGS